MFANAKFANFFGMAIECTEKHKDVSVLNEEIKCRDATDGCGSCRWHCWLEVWAAGVHCVGVAEVIASFLGFLCAEGFSVGHSRMAGAELLESFVAGAGIGLDFAGRRILRDVEKTE